MKKQHSENILHQIHHDLTNRARGGIFIYIIVWTVFAYWADIPQTSPTVFWINTALFVTISILKLIHYWQHTTQPLWNIRFMYRWLTLLLLFGAVHWGALSAWLIAFSPYEKLYYPTIIVLSAFAMGGTATLSIATSIRNIYALIIYAPSICAILYRWGNDVEIVMLIIMAVFSTLYILIASAASSRDYYSAITNRELAEQSAAKLKALSTTDSLTQLKNRMHLNQCFIEDWKRCNRANQSLCIMMIDLDHFKKINDQYGHSAGDLCLQSAAGILTEVFARQTDTVARYGGEEFVVLLPNTKLINAQKLAAKLVHRFRQTQMNFQQHRFSVTCSIGIACILPGRQVNHERLLMAADQAMYRAKENGRNQWQVGCIEQLRDTNSQDLTDC